ncbi:MAG TPA: rRNA maturation RNase YbeY [Opitutaceae bacterium]|jgi:probable rRNA maturation factor|nr:rRNA maturation RNase YbeY [Opitutaceae bacterium]
MGSTRALEIAVRRRGLSVDRRALATAVAVLDHHAEDFLGGCPPGELSLVFMADAELAELHGRFLADPTPTDVITFEGESSSGTAGEICVSVDAAVRQVGRAQARFSAEMLLYVVHGWLHLAGYDDLRPAAKRVMRRAEARAIKILAAGGKMPRFKLA